MLRELYSMLSGDLNGKEIKKKKKGYICIRTTDLLHYTVETNTKL